MSFHRFIWALSLSILIFVGMAFCGSDMDEGSSDEASGSFGDEDMSFTFTSSSGLGFIGGIGSTSSPGISIGHSAPVYYPPGYYTNPQNALSSATSSQQQVGPEGSLYDPKIKQIYDAMTVLLSDLADKKTKFDKGLMTKKDYQLYLSNMDMSLTVLNTMLTQAKNTLTTQKASMPAASASGTQTTPSNPH